MHVELDLDRIAGTLTHRSSPATAIRFLEATEATLMLLEEMPTLGALWESPVAKLAEVRFWTLRRFPHYVIFYLPVSDGIKVLRVLRGEQEIESRLLEAVD
jgi:plasmid stabilization system protein ParE